MKRSDGTNPFDVRTLLRRYAPRGPCPCIHAQSSLRRFRPLITAVLAFATLALPAPSAAAIAPALPVATLRPGLAWAGSGIAARQLEAAPYIKSGRTLVPVRAVAETLGANVTWNEAAREVRINLGGHTLRLPVGRLQMNVDGRAVSLEIAPEIVASRTFVPLRAVAEGLGTEVEWNAETRSIVVSGLGRRPQPSELELYAAQLVNLDRSAQGLDQVGWDDTAARAGRLHARDMAEHGFFSHWNREGDLPGFRYSQAGGRDAVAENLATIYFQSTSANFFQAPDWARVLRHHDGLMKSEGHRRNILAPGHTHLGVGLAVGPHGGTYLAQEFVDRYGTYDPLPARAAVGTAVRVSGELVAGARPYGIFVAYHDRRPMSADELNQTSSYADPWPPFARYFPPGYVSDGPMEWNGNRFSATVNLSDRGRPGIYYVYITANLPGFNDPQPVSIRAITVE